MKRPRLLVVIGNLARMGGAERQALFFVKHLATTAYAHVEVLTFEDGPELREVLEGLGVSVHSVSYYERWPRGKRTRALARIAALLRYKILPDAILPFGAPASKVAGLVWPLIQARFAWWNQQDEGRGLGQTAVERRILHSLPCVTSNSTVGRDFLAEAYDLPPEKILVYNNGTPLIDGTSSGTWRRKLASGQRKVVTMVANISRYKDHLTLIDAWRAVSDHFAPSAKPMLLLAGNLRQINLVSSLKTKAFDHGLSSDDVRFLGAVRDVPELLLDSDLVVHSSLTEGCPNAVCEAMAAGRAVVATDIPGCRQAMGDENEWLAEAGNPAALAMRIVRLLEDDELRHTIGEHNRERIKTHFSLDGMNTFFVKRIEEGLRVAPRLRSRARSMRPEPRE